MGMGTRELVGKIKNSHTKKKIKPLGLISGSVATAVMRYCMRYVASYNIFCPNGHLLIPFPLAVGRWGWGMAVIVHIPVPVIQGRSRTRRTWDLRRRTGIIHNTRYKTSQRLPHQNKTVGFGQRQRPLHGRCTRTDACVRWEMAVTYQRG